eukprot:COSAG01_NODE_95_length_26957_cov_48.328617_11_plen_115_part_00
MDSGGVTHIPGTNYNNFAWENSGAVPCTRQHCPADYTRPIQPTANMCAIYNAWTHFLSAAPRMVASLEPWNYDLVNTGREVLYRLRHAIALDTTFPCSILHRPGLTVHVRMNGR